MRCKTCNKWDVSPVDRFCSGCGTSLIALKLEQEILPYYPTVAGDVKPGAITLVNTGTRRARASITVPEGFQLLSPDMVELEPDDPPCRIEFEFPVRHTGFQTESITVSVEQGPTLRAKVICAPPPVIELRESEIVVMEGARGPYKLTLLHRGGGPAVIESARSVRGTFTVVKAAGVLEERGELPVLLQFPGGAPARSGEYDDQLELTLVNGEMPVTLRMRVAVSRPPHLDLSTDQVDFGDVLPGRTPVRILRIENTGESPLIISRILPTSKDDRWSLKLPQLPVTIRRNDTREVEVALQSTVPGAVQGSFEIYSNDPVQPEARVSVTASVLDKQRPFQGFVGIDFGTTNSCICVSRGNEEPHLLELDEGGKDAEDRFMLPSAVYWEKPPQGNLWDCTVGRMAYNEALNPRNARNVVLSVKRDLGTKEVYRIHGVPVTPQQVAARIIRRLLDAAEDYLVAAVTKAIVTVPANFAPPQIRATQEACEIAGLNVAIVKQHHMDEPVGAALDYLAHLEVKPSDDYNCLVYDFGGGTLDISIIRDRREEKNRVLDVVSSRGNVAFGGDDLTEILRQHLQKLAEEETKGRVPAEHPKRWKSIASSSLREVNYHNYVQLRALAEDFKRRLSDATVVTDGKTLQVVYGSEPVERFVQFSVEQDDYEELIIDKLRESRTLVNEALRAAGLTWEDIAIILLVGKSSRTPLVHRLLANWSGLTPTKHPEPKACVARGAHKQGELLTKPQAGTIYKAVHEMTKTNCRYGIEIERDLRYVFQTLIPEGTKFPAEGRYGGRAERLLIPPGATVTVSMNRGRNDLVRNNPDVIPLGEVTVDEDLPESLPLEVVLRVLNHRSYEVDLYVNGLLTRNAHFKEN